jgi:alpha-beta hydrolase superfamily lysophospholipase
MGSVITRYFLQTNPNTIVKKAIIMGTLPKYPLIQVKAMRTLAFLLGLFKSSNLRHQGLANVLNSGLIKTIENPKTDFDWLSYNQNNVDLYVQDPLCGYAYNKRFYQSFFKLIDKVNKISSMKNLKTMPLLFIAGIDDPINQNMKGINKLVKLYQRINPTLAIEVQAIDKARHEILHENNKKETYDIIKTFLTK